jgi:hypothetical protein
MSRNRVRNISTLIFSSRWERYGIRNCFERIMLLRIVAFFLGDSAHMEGRISKFKQPVFFDPHGQVSQEFAGNDREYFPTEWLTIPWEVSNHKDDCCYCSELIKFIWGKQRYGMSLPHLRYNTVTFHPMSILPDVRFMSVWRNYLDFPVKD